MKHPRWQMENPHHSGAISARGMIATMTIEAATDREIFLAYLDEVLCQNCGLATWCDGQSQFAQGQGSARKNRGGRSPTALPATLLARPEPYREGLGQAQTTLRTAKARTKEALDQAIAELLPLLTAEDARAWFRLHSPLYSNRRDALRYD